MMAAALGACGGLADEETTSDELSYGAKTRAPMLNLSHIECTEDGRLLVHFVLLFAGTDQPGPLTGTYNGGAFGPVEADKSSGNVWHYNVILPDGEIEILSASVTTAQGVVVWLHNPGEYSGNYQCGGEQLEQCPVSVTPGAYCIETNTMGNPGDECAHFGLVPQGKDDNLGGLTFPASQDAYVAIVKTGNGGCGQGESAYDVFVNVEAGEWLGTSNGQAISHITYCACPE